MLKLEVENLKTANIVHGFLGRAGGVSKGIYASLNCGTGSNDAPNDVAENRKRAVTSLAGDRRTALVTCYQIHSANTLTVGEPWNASENPKADAMVTDRNGIMLGILTADCAPVLLADGQARVIGAAHAGWSGALSGIIESVVAAMTGLGARRERISAAIGPCISQAAYEVGPEFEARFRNHAAAYSRFFSPSIRSGYWQFGLEDFVAARLKQAGVGAIAPLLACTYSRESDFFSYRRATHRSEPDYGRQLSAIALPV
jgi:YfiH family protein